VKTGVRGVARLEEFTDVVVPSAPVTNTTRGGNVHQDKTHQTPAGGIAECRQLRIDPANPDR
jgi:hypothetical protein